MLLYQEYVRTDVIKIKEKDIARCEIPRVSLERVSIGKVEYSTISIKVMKRGVVGVNKIAYVM